MKIVLSWVFEHIQAPLSSIDIDDLVKQLTQKTTEIESVSIIKRDRERFALAQIKQVETDAFVCVTRLGTSIKVSKDILYKEGDILLLYEDDQSQWRLASCHDLGSARYFSLPSLYVDDSEEVLSLIPETEVVLEISNNAIAHRPDLWSHRGFAREIAAIYGFLLKPLDSFMHQTKIITDMESVIASSDSPFSITLENQASSLRFAGLYIKSIQHKKTTLDMLSRLSLVDCKPIDLLIDCSNYVMYDIGQPIHTYDADLLTEKRIVVRMADQNTELMLLDGEAITLSDKDIVVADGLAPIALAGIMGGLQSKITAKTTSLFIESAHFDAYLVRQSAARHARRTEAAVRFSRNIDPNQNVFGIMRYIKLLDQYKIPYIASAAIQSVGAIVESTNITIIHSFIENRLGITLTSQRVLQLLNALGFDVEKQNDIYHITVPTSRSKRDISIPEDIVEEIGRLVGYETIPLQLPSVMTRPKLCTSEIRNMRAIKNVLSFGFCMRELHNYSLFDEAFLHKISYQPGNAVLLKNPISSERTRLVTTLLVHLLQAINIHKEQRDYLRFFEIARCWQVNEEGVIEEKEKIAGILFDKTSDINFYDGKHYVDRLCAINNIMVSYKTANCLNNALFDGIKCAAMYLNNVLIGYCGMSNKNINNVLFEGKSCFMFEFDAGLFAAELREHRYREISRFPSVMRDISLFLSHRETAAELIEMIRIIDVRIRSVEVVDFFEKKEWEGKRALTLRIIMQDNEKTLSSADVDAVIAIINKQCEIRGIQIR